MQNFVSFATSMVVAFFRKVLFLLTYLISYVVFLIRRVIVVRIPRFYRFWRMAVMFLSRSMIDRSTSIPDTPSSECQIENWNKVLLLCHSIVLQYVPSNFSLQIQRERARSSMELFQILRKRRPDLRLNPRAVLREQVPILNAADRSKILDLLDPLDA